MWLGWEHGNIFGILVNKPLRKRQSGELSRIYEDNINMDLGQIGCKSGS
jgi:hypothetical protein